jgi:hypothetical protein
MSESDGIEEAIEGISRVGMTVAGRLGEQLARARETALRRAQAAEEQQGRELQARFDAERAAARAQLAPVMDNRWWDTASGRDIERVHETSTAWKDHDPAARNAADTIRDQVQRRYGVDVDNLGANESSVARAAEGKDRSASQVHEGPSELEQARTWAKETDPEYLRQWDQRHNAAETVESGRSDETELVNRWKELTGQADQERRVSREEMTQAAYLLAEAAREDKYRQDQNLPTREDLDHAREWLRETNPIESHNWESRHQFADYLADEHDLEKQLFKDWTAAQDSDKRPAVAREEAGIKYDSAERRQGLAASLDSVADKEAVQARLSADQDQGTRPSAAVGKASGKAPKARKTRGANGPEKILQKGMSR